MLDVHSLRIFSAVAENLSFTRAAETLFLTQSAVSHQVSSLEKELDTLLFERRGRTIELTSAGRVLLDRARKVFTSIGEAADAVKQAAQPGLGRLRIGASPTACQYIVPASLREFRECFPDYSLAITPGDSPLVGERVLDGSIDLGIMIRPEGRDKSGRLTFHDLFEDELGFVTSPLHAWAQKGKVDRRELATERMVLYSRGSTTYRAVERYLLKLKMPLRDPIELGSMEAIKELVKLGLGVSVIAKWVARVEIAQGSLVWLSPPGMRLKRRWAVAVPTGKVLSLAEQTFVGLCRSAAANLTLSEAKT